MQTKEFLKISFPLTTLSRPPSTPRGVRGHRPVADKHTTTNTNTTPTTNPAVEFILDLSLSEMLSVPTSTFADHL
ncbi:hypothetical protein J6590_031627 [Homalodisca vitripennis]|nr:hypothetical protein J6590_031627 [Homalodisca vitripennis]